VDLPDEEGVLGTNLQCDNSIDYFGSSAGATGPDEQADPVTLCVKTSAEGFSAEESGAARFPQSDGHGEEIATSLGGAHNSRDNYFAEDKLSPQGLRSKNGAAHGDPFMCFAIDGDDDLLQAPPSPCFQGPDLDFCDEGWIDPSWETSGRVAKLAAHYDRLTAINLGSDLDHARNAAPQRDDPQSTLYDSFKGWYDRAEDELCDIYHIGMKSRSKFKGRGDTPHFAKVPLIPRKAPSPFKVSETARAARVLATRARYFANGLWALGKKGTNHKGQSDYALSEWKAFAKAARLTDQSVIQELDSVWVKIKPILDDDWGARINNCDDDLGDLINRGIGHIFQVVCFCVGVANNLEQCDIKRNNCTYKAWLEESSKSGGGRIHRHTKPKTQPFNDQEGCEDPYGHSNRVIKRWSEIWTSNGQAPCSMTDLDDDEQLPRPSASALRGAASSFSWDTGVGSDCFKPRWFALLSDEALEWLISIYMYCEKVGRLPSQANFTVLVGIPKPAGGERLIGLLSSFYRVWVRLRRPDVQQRLLRHWSEALCH
jgi:hypothetical protein